MIQRFKLSYYYYHYYLTPATTTFLQADTQSSPLLRSTCPNHLNLHALPPQPRSQPPKRLYKSTLRFLSFSDTPHIHTTIIRSRLCRFAFFIAQVSVPYINTLRTQALYIFPFMRYDSPLAVRLGNYFLNLAQAHLTLALAVLLPPPHFLPPQVCCPNSKT